MTIQVEPPSTEPPSHDPRPCGQLVVGVVVLALLAAGLGFMAGQGRSRVHDEDVRCYSGPDQTSCRLNDDWTVSVPLDVAWSGDGTEHDGGRPACVAPTGESETRSSRALVSWVPVTVDGISWRLVVHVTCAS